MATTSALAVLPSSSDRSEWSDEEKATVEAAGLVFVHAYGEHRGEKVLAPRPVVARFLHTCQKTGLDPLARQIYCIGRWGSDGLEWSIQTGIDGFRVVAERSKKYAGQGAAQWLTADGDWVPVFVKALHGDHPLAARVDVYRTDWNPDKPAVGVATWDEYAQTKRSGELTAMWAQRGPGQLAKCAEALALRKAFPQDLSGIYTDDEMTAEVIEVTEAPSEDWAKLIAAAKSTAELEAVGARIAGSEEGDAKLQAAYRARAAVLAVEEPAEEPAPDATSDRGLTEAEYEAESAAEFDAAVAAGEVSRG